jgi:hypothetical protein
LGGGKMKEAQADGAGAILQANNQTSAPTKSDIGHPDLTLYDYINSVLSRAYGGNSSAVLVA